VLLSDFNNILPTEYPEHDLDQSENI